MQRLLLPPPVGTVTVTVTVSIMAAMPGRSGEVYAGLDWRKDRHGTAAHRTVYAAPPAVNVVAFKFCVAESAAENGHAILHSRCSHLHFLLAYEHVSSKARVLVVKVQLAPQVSDVGHGEGVAAGCACRPCSAEMDFAQQVLLYTTSAHGFVAAGVCDDATNSVVEPCMHAPGA